MKQLNIKISLLFFLLCIPYFSEAQDVETIIARHIEAHGGTERWSKIKNMKITGNYTAFSEKKPFTFYKESPNMYYGDLFLGKNRVVEAYNGLTGWTIDPWQDITFPRKTNSAENNVFQQKAVFCTPFFNYKENGFTVEFVGTETVDGIEVYVIKLTRTPDFVEKWYLNTETYLEYKCLSLWIDFAYPLPGETFFDDFRNINGLIIPYYVENIFGQRDVIMEIQNIEFNTQIEKKLYEMPRSEQITKLAFLTGEWNVAVEVWTRRGTWYLLDKTTSSIKFEGTNLLVEKICYDNYFVQDKIISFTYNQPTENYRITIFDDFSSAIDIYTGNFSDNSFIFSNSTYNLNNEPEERMLTQYVINNITENGFVLEIQNSTDKGATWNPSEKLTYTKQ